VISASISESAAFLAISTTEEIIHMAGILHHHVSNAVAYSQLQAFHFREADVARALSLPDSESQLLPAAVPQRSGQGAFYICRRNDFPPDGMAEHAQRAGASHVGPHILILSSSFSLSFPSLQTTYIHSIHFKHQSLELCSYIRLSAAVQSTH
jgi:hypothetical protein